MPLLERIAHPIHGSRRRKDRLRQAKMVDPDRGLHVHTEGEPQRPLHRPVIDPTDGLPCKARAHDLETHMPAGVPPERSTDLVPRPADEFSRAEGVHVGELAGSAVDVRVEEGIVTAIVPTPEGTLEQLVVLEKQEELGTTVHATHVEQAIIHEEHIDKEFVHEHHVTQEILHEHHIDQPIIHEKHIEVPVVHEKHIEKPVIHEKHIERPIIHEKHIEQPVIHERHVEQPIIHEKHIEKPIIHEKHIEQPIIHEKHIEKPIIHEKHIEQPVIHERHIEKPVVHETHVEQVIVHQVHHVQPIVHQTHVNEKTIAEHVVAPAIIEQIVLREQAAMDRDERTAPRIVEQTNETAAAIVKVEQDIESIQKVEQMQTTVIQEVIREDGGILPPTIVREEGVIETAVIVRDIALADEKLIVENTGKTMEVLPPTVQRLDEVAAAKVVIENAVEKPVVVTDTELCPPKFVQESDVLKTSYTLESSTLPVQVIQEGFHHHHDGVVQSDVSRVDATVLHPDIPPTVVATAPVAVDHLAVPTEHHVFENPLAPPTLVMESEQHHEHHGLKDTAKHAISTISHPIHHHKRDADEPVAVLPV